MGGRIVVGVDGSDGSTEALRWAVREAGLRKATVDVVHAWQQPYVGDAVGFAAYPIDRGELEKDAQAVLDRCIATAHSAGDGVRIEPILVFGGAAATLVKAARGALGPTGT